MRQTRTDLFQVSVIFSIFALSAVGFGGCDDTPADPGPSDVLDDGPTDLPPDDLVDEPDFEPGQCGNGVIEPPEVCDDGQLNGLYDQCTNSCDGIGPHCGDGHVDYGAEICDDGASNGQYGYCRGNCSAEGPFCGDGDIDEGYEVCDDGDANGTHGHCLDDCTETGPFCGDGIITVTEEACDDAELNGTYDHCADDCLGVGSHCGDGVVDEDDEACDDGELNGGYGYCGVDCSPPPFPFQAQPVLVSDDWLADPPTCDADDWFTKYLHYRLRLRGNGTADWPGFVSVGPDAGESIPASFRNPTTDCGNDWWLSDSGCSLEHPENTNGKLSWGDATIWLGEYIAVLATEYAVFDAVGLDTTETLQDLYFALNAVNRLDETADLYFDAPPTLDGFFLRDDVPADLIWADDGETLRYPRDDDGLVGYGCVNSASACETPDIADGDYTSQDQIIGLIWGLAFVNELVPDDVAVDGMDLRHEARSMVHRFVWNLRDNNWRVTAPDGSHPPDEWGGNAHGFSDQLAKAAAAICDDDFGLDSYEDAITQTVGVVTFEALDVQAAWEVTHGYNRTMAFRLVSVTNVWDALKMARRAMEDAKEVFALGHAVLNQLETDPTLSNWRIESLLSMAPCGGPCNRVEGCEGAEGWRGQHRFTSPGDRAIWQHHPRGEYNGLDYMLAHNLYFLARDGTYDLAVPEPPMERCLDVDTLDDIVDAEGDLGAYDPTDTCHLDDMSRRFCGRSWASWIDGAYRDEVTLITGNYRWSCNDTEPCTLVEGNFNGTSDADLILGTSGNDDLDGNGGDDCIYGLDGNDTIAGGQQRDELHGGNGNDELYGENSGIVVTGANDILWGDDGDDFLKGNYGDDELYGGEGNDEIVGDGGGDFIEGHGGHDVIDGEAGDDRINGGSGDDVIRGGGGDDVIYGEDGNDAIDGEGDLDWIYGNAGDDMLLGGNGDDMLADDSGADRLCAENGDDTIWAGWDGDDCLGGSGDDTIHGCEDNTATEEECSDDAFEAW